MSAANSLAKGLYPVLQKVFSNVTDNVVSHEAADNIAFRLGKGEAPDKILGSLRPEIAAAEPELRAILGKDFLRDGQPYTKRSDVQLLSVENPMLDAPAEVLPPPDRGSAEELFPSVFNRIRESAASPAEKEMMRNSAYEMLGYQPQRTGLDRAVDNFAGAATGFQVATKLGLGAVSQLSQFLTGVVRTEMRGSMSSLVRSFKDPESMSFAMESGATLGSVVREAESMLMGADGDVTQKILRLTQFTKMDVGARAFSALQGSAMLEHQADELYRAFKAWGGKGPAPTKVRKIEGKLLGLGIDPRDVIAQGGRLTRDQRLYAANTAAFDVNFWGDSLSVPAFWRSPAGRVAFQFKSFAYQQSVMMKRHVIDPWVKYGDYGPALRFALLIPLGGEVIADIKAFLRGRKRTDNMSLRLIENLTQAGTFGMAADVFMQSQRGFAGTASYAVGPTVSDAITIAEAGAEVFEGDPRKAIEAGIRMSPGVVAAAVPGAAVPAALLSASAPGAANTLFPAEDAVENSRRREGRERREAR